MMFEPAFEFFVINLTVLKSTVKKFQLKIYYCINLSREETFAHVRNVYNSVTLYMYNLVAFTNVLPDIGGKFLYNLKPFHFWPAPDLKVY